MLRVARLVFVGKRHVWLLVFSVLSWYIGTSGVQCRMEKAGWLSLREIARQLGIPPSSIAYYRDRFAVYLPAPEGEGRRARYPAVALEIFRAIRGMYASNWPAERIEAVLAVGIAEREQEAEVVPAVVRRSALEGVARGGGLEWSHPLLVNPRQERPASQHDERQQSSDSPESITGDGPAVQGECAPPDEAVSPRDADAQESAAPSAEFAMVEQLLGVQQVLLETMGALQDELAALREEHRMQLQASGERIRRLESALLRMVWSSAGYHMDPAHVLGGVEHVPGSDNAGQVRGAEGGSHPQEAGGGGAVADNHQDEVGGGSGADWDAGKPDTAGDAAWAEGSRAPADGLAGPEGARAAEMPDAIRAEEASGTAGTSGAAGASGASGAAGGAGEAGAAGATGGAGEAGASGKPGAVGASDAAFASGSSTASNAAGGQHTTHSEAEPDPQDEAQADATRHGGTQRGASSNASGGGRTDHGHERQRTTGRYATVPERGFLQRPLVIARNGEFLGVAEGDRAFSLRDLLFRMERNTASAYGLAMRWRRMGPDGWELTLQTTSLAPGGKHRYVLLLDGVTTPNANDVALLRGIVIDGRSVPEGYLLTLFRNIREVFGSR